MDSSQIPKNLSANLFYLFLLLSSNLLTFFLSSTYSSPTCSLTAATFSAGTTFETATTTTSAMAELPPEFVAFTSPQKLPRGFNPNFGSDTIQPPVGGSCTLFPAELRHYMSYDVNGSCPDDEFLAQRLLLKGCEPLRRRRCRPAAPMHATEPHPLPDSLWKTPADNSVVWTAYKCKNYECLINRPRFQKGLDDCKDCFDLNGREKRRWTSRKSGGLDFSIDDVLAVKKPGTIRIGLDIGGGVATFAVRMRERNVTVITTSINLNGPFNSFIASRGVIPMYLSVSQRLPFFDNTLDIVHSMHVLSNWIPTTMMHFLLFDIYRYRCYLVRKSR